MNLKFFNQEQSSLKNYFSKEELSFLHIQKDSYWSINGHCLHNKLSLFGDLPEKAKEYYKYLFYKTGTSTKQSHNDNDSHHFPAETVTVDPYETCFGEKTKSEVRKDDSSLPISPILPIYNLIPEIKKINRKLSYSELYNILSLFSDNKLLFINIYKNNSYENLVSAVCLFPILPVDISILNKISLINNEFSLKIDNFFLNLASLFNISFDYPMNKGSPFNDYQTQRRAVIQQKLIDVYNLSNDSDDLHAVSFCHNHFESCVNYSSSFCENNLCKNCCEVSNILYKHI